MSIEEVPDHNLWLLATFAAQCEDKFSAWWTSLGERKQRKRVEELGVPAALSAIVANSLLVCLAHYSKHVDTLGEPPAADGTVRVPAPSGEIGDTIGGLANLIAKIIEGYQDDVLGTEAAQLLVPASEVRATSAQNEACAEGYADLKELRRRYRVSDKDVEAVLRDEDSAAAGMGGSRSTPGDYSEKLRRRLKRDPSWMNPGPGKRVEACRSPTFSLTVGSRRAAAGAIATVRKIRHAGASAQPSGRVVADLAKCFGVLGSCLITIDNMVLPPSVLRGTQVVEAFQLVEAARTEARDSAVIEACGAAQLGVFVGHMILIASPQLAVDSFERCLSVCATFKGPEDDKQHALTTAAAHVGLSTCWIMTGDLRRAERALTAAIGACAWEPHEDADWRCRRAGLLARRARSASSSGAAGAVVEDQATRRLVAHDLERAVAGLTPDDESFAAGCFLLAEELARPDGLCGDAARGFAYWRLGEAALRRQLWLFGAKGAKFAGDRERELGAIHNARELYTRLLGGISGGKVGGQQVGGMGGLVALVEKQRTASRERAAAAAASSAPCAATGLAGKARLCCSLCSREDGGGTGLKIMRCTRCLSAAYCGRACQLKHWPSHKAVCKAIAKTREEQKKGSPPKSTPVDQVD